jgi:hypothetical protein
VWVRFFRAFGGRAFDGLDGLPASAMPAIVVPVAEVAVRPDGGSISSP